MRKVYKFPITRNKAGIILIFIFCLYFASAVYVFGDSPPDAEMVGDEVCSACHDEIGHDFSKNLHARLSVGEGNTCEACHGAGSRHAEERDPTLIYNPTKEYTSTGKNPCANCHRGEAFTSWQGSAHFEIAGGCGDCHRIHSLNEKLLLKPERELCFDCHKDKRSEARMPSHHPVLEGFVSCLDCHSVHTEEAEFTLEHNRRELCLSCHSMFEGPFVFEHQPVNEDCGICHKPHGTVADKLLIQNEPFLCLSCHPMHFHTTLLGFEGEFEAPVHPERVGVSTQDGMKKAFLTKCTQCHSEVHGTDLPSQSVSGLGRALTR